MTVQILTVQILTVQILTCNRFFQLIKRQFGVVSRGTRATVGAPVPAAALTSLDLAGHVRDKLPVQKRDDYLELEAWLADGDDEVLTANRAQLKDFIA